MAVPPKIENRIAIESCNYTSGHVPKELKVGTQTGICTPTFTAAVFTVAKGWKQTKCPSTEWINKMWSIQTRVLFSLEKEILTHATIWLDHKDLMQRDIH